MRALTLTQPFAYLSGALHGDAWLTPLTLGLRSKDQDFAETFSAAVASSFSVRRQPRQDERGYWLYRTSNKTGRFNPLFGFEPQNNEERRAWLRGMFDSEGNVQLRLNGMSTQSYGRRVAFYSTNTITLNMCSQYLMDLGMLARLNPTKASTGHLGDKVVYELCLRGSLENYQRFAALVGSSIQRKRDRLDAIPGTYKPDRSAHCRAAQKIGAAIRSARRDAGGKY